MTPEEDKLETVMFEGQQFVLHPYHCPLDGDQLVELPLGFLMCRKCKTEFIPARGHMKGEYELSWMDENGWRKSRERFSNSAI